ncbi:MAG: porin family protein [Calditrichaeota bacterium]|nr:porin family protein [Calditrichota bacterium]
MKKLVLFAAAAAMVLTLSVGANAQSKIGLMGVGGKAGLVMPEGDIGNTLGLGGVVRLGHIIPTIALDAFVDFWKKSYDVGVIGYKSSVSYTEIAIAALAKYYIPMEGKLKPYAGAGLGLTIGTSSISIEGAGVYGVPLNESTSTSDTNLGVHFVGGAEMPLTPTLDGFGEIKYSIDGADYLSIMAGVVYKLGK